MKARLFLLAACAALPTWAEDLPVPTTPPPVVTEILSHESPVIRSYPAVVSAVNEVTLAFQLGGLMVERAADLGDSVLAGQPLALLDQTSLAEDVAAAQAALRAAEAQAQAAQLSFQRAQTLNERGIAATAQLEGARAAQDTTAAAVDAARATLARAEDAQRFSGLVAPSEGVITAVHAETGTVVTAGQPIVTLAAAAAREVVIDVPASQLSLFTTEARFIVSDRNGDTQTGAGLRLIEPVTERAARTHRVRIVLDSPVLRLGSLVTVQLDVAQAQVLSLPAQAITPQGTIWRVTPERQLEEIPVILGDEVEDRRIIKGGVDVGDEILVRGLGAAQDGLIVGERIAQ